MTLIDDSSEEVGPQMWAYILKLSDKGVKHEQRPAITQLSWWKVRESVDDGVLSQDLTQMNYACLSWSSQQSVRQRKQ